DDLNFLSTFLHNSKRFISPVSSCSQVWGGLMWAIGWRRSYDKDQIFGRYIKQFRRKTKRLKVEATIARKKGRTT
ncbi:hypothetical protein VP01_9251g1, partial [Puccinia sorghi]